MVKVPALSAAMLRRVGIGDIGLRRLWKSSTRCTSCDGKEKADAVLITGSPFYPFLLAGMIKREFRVPVILDFQDPWISNGGALRAPLTKGWAANLLARMLEPRAVASADFITSVSERQNEELLARYPAFPRDSVAAIPIGGDAGDYDICGRIHLHRSRSRATGRRDQFELRRTMLPRSRLLLEALFSAVHQLVLSGEEWVGRLRLNFVGTSNQPNGFRRSESRHWRKNTRSHIW